MKKMIIGYFIYVVIAATLIGFTINMVTKGWKEQTRLIESKVGKKYVVDKDTVFIINYSSLENVYIDSNNKKYSFSLINGIKPMEP